MILLIDNYDSFSYNLYQLVGTLNPDIRVIRNDDMAAQEILDLAPSHIILSPGPGRPSDAGVCEDVVRVCGGTIPILGVCLGHQAICEVYGARVTYAKELMHGKQSEASFDAESVLFRGLNSDVDNDEYSQLGGLYREGARGAVSGGENSARVRSTVAVARYHSLAADPATLPPVLRVTAQTDDGEIMAVQHTEFPVFGVQFHPESILTAQGIRMIANFLNI